MVVGLRQGMVGQSLHLGGVEIAMDELTVGGAAQRRQTPGRGGLEHHLQHRGCAPGQSLVSCPADLGGRRAMRRRSQGHLQAEGGLLGEEKPGGQGGGKPWRGGPSGGFSVVKKLFGGHSHDN
ncbi:MAG: hypothetical protein F4194_00480 [Acidimicrobiia bacterium]|nr:hypothetical protein [Acidimicrobiia bacterium]